MKLSHHIILLSWLSFTPALLGIQHNVITIDQLTYKQYTKRESKPLIIDVYAPWCGPCKHMMPIFEEIAQEFGNLYTFGKFNVNESPELAKQFNVMSLPTYLFFKNGVLIGREKGTKSKVELKKIIENYFKETTSVA